MDVTEIVNKWPSSWSYDAATRQYGEKLLEEMRPFVRMIAEHGYTKKTVERHLENLFFLGGEIIRGVSIDERYDEDAAEVLRESVIGGEGPLCQHLHIESEERAYDATCRKLDKFLKGNL